MAVQEVLKLYVLYSLILGTVRLKEGRFFQFNALVVV